MRNILKKTEIRRAEKEEKIIKFKAKYVGSLIVQNPIAMPSTNVIKIEPIKKPKGRPNNQEK